jgi:aldose 1-epimerase
MALTGRQFTITAGAHQATIVEVGAGLRRYAVDGQDVTVSYGEDELPPRGCGAVLVPWPNRLRDGRYSFQGRGYQVPINETATNSANHGLARWVRWQLVGREQSSVTLLCDLVPQPGWPFEVSVFVTYSVDSDQGLSVTAAARNRGRLAAPFGIGFHPYISPRGAALDELALMVPAERHLIVDGQQIPVRSEPVAGTPYDFRSSRQLRSQRLDEGFAAVQTPGAVELRGPSGGARLEYDESFRFLQVYTNENLGGGRSGVAVEPMTCPANAFNSGDGLVVLEPGTGSWSGIWGLRPL